MTAREFELGKKAVALFLSGRRWPDIDDALKLGAGEARRYAGGYFLAVELERAKKRDGRRSPRPF